MKSTTTVHTSATLAQQARAAAPEAVDRTAFMAGVALAIRMLNRGDALKATCEADLSSEYRPKGVEQNNYALSFIERAAGGPTDQLRGFAAALSSFCAADDPIDVDAYFGRLTYEQIAGPGQWSVTETEMPAATGQVTGDTILEFGGPAAVWALGDAAGDIESATPAKEANYMAGVGMAIEMLLFARSKEGTPDGELMELDGTHRPGQRQDNVALNYLRAVMKHPELAEGFAAVLTAVIGPNVLDGGYVEEFIMLDYERMIIPTVRRDPDTGLLPGEPFGDAAGDADAAPAPVPAKKATKPTKKTKRTAVPA